MSIDPTKFEAQGRPTKEQAQQVWQDHNRPSCRRLADIMTGLGYDISYRTLARWIDFSANTTRATSGKVKGIDRAITTALLGATAPEKLDQSAGARAQETILSEETIIHDRIKELLLESEANLDIIEQKSRKIMNILLAEATARRAHVMVLIPKDTAALVESFTTASKQTLTGGLDQPPKAGDPKVIEHEEKSPLASSISNFLIDQGMVG